MRAADKRRVPPSRYLGLPWKPWGETDYWLTQGLDNLDERICHCGSGLFRADCTDPDVEDRLQILTETHYGRLAIDRYQEQQKDPEPAEYVSLVLLPEGQTARDPNDLRKEAAAAEIAAMKARHGQK